MHDADDNSPEVPARRALAPAAERALAEAEQRRSIARQEAEVRAREIGGRKGPDPVRFGDWEVKGIATDF